MFLLIVGTLCYTVGTLCYTVGTLCYPVGTLCYPVGTLCYMILLYKSTYHPKCRNCVLRNLVKVKICGLYITLIYPTNFQLL